MIVGWDATLHLYNNVSKCLFLLSVLISPQLAVDIGLQTITGVALLCGMHFQRSCAHSVCVVLFLGTVGAVVCACESWKQTSWVHPASLT